MGNKKISSSGIMDAMYPPKAIKHFHWLTIIASLAGLLYCSWPLGNYLNPIANRGLASNLEASGQPYNWVFIGLDIISGALMCWVSWKLIPFLLQHRRSLWLMSAVSGLAIFGLLTAVDAVLPLDCVNTIQKCPSIWTDPSFIVHGIASIGSVYGLTISIVAIWWLLIHSKQTGQGLRWLLHATMLLWFGFGALTGLLIILNVTSALAQHVFIIVCSLWTGALPYFVQRALKLIPARKTSKR